MLASVSAAEAKTSGTWDLVTLIAADESRPSAASVVYSGAHGETRTAVRLQIPGAVSYPVRVPPRGRLRFGYALQSAAFMAETPELAEPARVVVELAGAEGAKHVLLDRELDLRARAEDRRWFGADVDLSAFAGTDGTLTFRVQPTKGDGPIQGTVAYYSTPRIVPAGDRGASVVFITIDCRRADHVGAYGYARPTTPTLDRLAADGIRFAHAYTNAPITLPSIPQIFTSAVFPSKDQDTLTSPIARHGIANLAVVNNAWIPLWLG